jgi:hypothetical protein
MARGMKPAISIGGSASETMIASAPRLLSENAIVATNPGSLIPTACICSGPGGTSNCTGAGSSNLTARWAAIVS